MKTDKTKSAPHPAADDHEEIYKPIEWAMVKRLLSTLSPYKKQYTLGIGLCAVHVSLEMTSPKFTQWIINYTSDYSAGNLQTPLSRAILHLMLIIGFWGCVYAVSIALQRKVILIMTNAGERVQFEIRRKLFNQLQRLSMSYYDKTRLGRIISRCTSDVSSLREVNVWGLNTLLMNGLMMIASAGLLAWTDWRLFLSVAWLAPALWIIDRVYRRKAQTQAQVAREGYTRVATNFAENISGMRVVAAFCRQSPNLAIFNTLQSANTDNNVQFSRINALYQPLLQVIGIIGKCVLLAYGGYLIAAGQSMRVGAVVAAYLYWDWFMNPISNLGAFLVQLMQAMAGAERIFSLLDLNPEVTDIANARDLPRIVGHVEFQKVTFGYAPDRPVLHDIEFTATPGSRVALVGHTGSGKSTIVSLIARFYQPQAGRVLVDGTDIRDITAHSLHRQMGLVLQNNFLFSGTVMDNIRYARSGATEEQVIQAAKDLGTHEMIMSLKEGYQTQVGERGASMSMGQRQLICFTRAFLADPRIFLLDEATSAVDTATEAVVQASLEKLLAGRTTFIVAHRLSTILKADLILVLEDGKIIERGNHAALLKQNGVYAGLYREFASGM